MFSDLFCLLRCRFGCLLSRMLSKLFDLLSRRLCCLLCCLLSKLFDLLSRRLGCLLCCLLSELFDLLGGNLGRLLRRLLRCRLGRIHFHLIEREWNAEDVHVGIERRTHQPLESLLLIRNKIPECCVGSSVYHYFSPYFFRSRGRDCTLFFTRS